MYRMLEHALNSRIQIAAVKIISRLSSESLGCASHLPVAGVVHNWNYGIIFGAPVDPELRWGLAQLEP